MRTTYIDTIVNEVSKRTHIRNANLVHLYALLVLIKGEEITLKDVHDAWSMDMNFRPRAGRCYGHDHTSIVPFDDLTSIVPFDDLSEETQNKDGKYVDTLRSIAREMSGRSE